MQSKTLQSPLVVVSNREPYMHVHRNKGIEALVPASGLVTALEPILRACDGTWIASGSGDADRETVDEHDRLRVPPDKPEYTLRRVWLTKEERGRRSLRIFERGSLAVVPHRLHAAYLSRVGLEKLSGREPQVCRCGATRIETAKHPLVLVQDYHFALLPRMIKEARPDARVAIFWHISLAESGSIRDLSVAARSHGWPAWCGPDRFSHSGPLQ